MTSEYRILNTSVSGAALLAALSGNDVRALEFDAATKQPRSKVLAGATGYLSADEWVQSAIGTLMLDPYNGSTNTINLGDDTYNQAALYISLFDMQSTSDERLLRFGLAATGPSINMANSSGSTSAHVQVNIEGVGSPSNSKVLFDSGVSAGGDCAGDGAGLERLVILKALNTTVGQEAVQFNILPKSV